MNTLQEIIAALSELDKTASETGMSRQFSEFVLTWEDESVREAILRGHQSGLINFALQCLRTAGQSTHGSHYHFDEAGAADRADQPLVVSLAKAPWESRGDA